MFEAKNGKGNFAFPPSMKKSNYNKWGNPWS